jgi:tetratricopeptide (TPR) repeat protein
VVAILEEIKDERWRQKEYYLMKGLAHFKLLNLQQALEALQQAQPELLVLQVYIGYLHLLLGDLEQAQVFAQRLATQHAAHPDIAVLRGNISLRQGRYEEARGYFRLALAQGDTRTKAAIGIANAYLLQRQFLHAEEYYVRAVFSAQQDVHAHIALAKYYVAMRRYDDAEATLHIALQLDPGSVNVIILLSNLYMKTGHVTDALQLLQQNKAQLPDSLILQMQTVRALLAVKKYAEANDLLQNFRGQDEEGALVAGEYFLRQHNLDFALFNFYKASKISTNSYLVNYYLGLVHFMRNDVLLAMQSLEKSIINYPSFVKAHLLLASIQLYMKKYALASEHARLVLQLDPKNTQAHIINGISLYMQGYILKASYEFDTVGILAPQNPVPHYFKALMAMYAPSQADYRNSLEKIDPRYIERLAFELNMVRDKEVLDDRIATLLDNRENFLSLIIIGDYYMRKSNLVMAEVYIKKAIETNAHCAVCYFKLAEIYREAGDAQLAVKNLRHTLQMDKRFLKAYQVLGIVYEQLQEHVQARMIYEQGLQYYPNDLILLNNLAWILLAHFADKPSAYVHIKRAAALAPEDPDIRDTLGWWYYADNNIERAVALLAPLIEAYPQRPIYRYHLGMAYQRQGKAVQARQHLQRALALGIAPEYARHIKEIIQ